MPNLNPVEGLVVEVSSDEGGYRAVIQRVMASEVALMDLKSRKSTRITREQFNDMLAGGTARYLRDDIHHGDLRLSDLPESEQLEVSRRIRYINAVCAAGIEKITSKNVKEVLAVVAEDIGETAPHWQTVRRWHKAYRAAGSKVRGLFPNHRAKGSRDSRLAPEVEQFLERAKKRYFTLSQSSIASAHKNVEDWIVRYNIEHPEAPLAVPSYEAIRKRLSAHPHYENSSKRSGKRASGAQELETSSDIKTTRILERVEVDHTPMGIYVLHDTLMTPLGRPLLTLLIDHYSHMILGLSLSFEEPSFQSVCLAFLNAFLPKQDYLWEAEITAEWPAHGIPSVIVTDNGKEFWSHDMDALSSELGFIQQYAPIRQPQYKSCVERLFGIIEAEVLDDLPGVVRKPDKAGEDYDAMKAARMTFSEFRCYLLTWIVEEFSNTPIPGSDRTPLELWHASEHDFPIPEEDVNELSLALLPFKPRKLKKGGIEINVLFYNSAVLKSIRRRDGDTSVKVKYNPWDLGYIYVRDEVNQMYHKVECMDFEYASGLSLFEHKGILADLKKRREDKRSNPARLAAKAKLHKQREAAHARNLGVKSKRQQAKAARAGTIGISKPKLIVDNAPESVNLEEDDAVDLDGWSVE